MIGQFSHDCIGWKTWKGRNPPKTDDKLYTSLSGQDGAILPARDYLLYPARKISQVCSVKMAGYWSHSFFVRNTQKKNLANIQTSWPHTWSITHIYWNNKTTDYSASPASAEDNNRRCRDQHNDQSAHSFRHTPHHALWLTLPLALNINECMNASEHIQADILNYWGVI